MEYDLEKISNKIKNKRKTKKIFKYIILSVLIVLFIINLILSFEENTHILGIYMFNIVSESMEPTLERNDVVVVQRCEPSQLQEGDIITFNKDEKTITHRILNITKDKKSIKFRTKGDKNEIPDPGMVEAEYVYGKVVLSLPKVGNMINYIQNVRGLINVALFAVILFVIISLRDNKKNNRRITRKKYEIKKIRDNYHL